MPLVEYLKGHGFWAATGMHPHAQRQDDRSSTDVTVVVTGLSVCEFHRLEGNLAYASRHLKWRFYVRCFTAFLDNPEALDDTED